MDFTKVASVSVDFFANFEESFWRSLLNIKCLAIRSMHCNKLHTWWSTQSQLATLLSSVIARQRVGPQTLGWFRLKDLSIDERFGAYCCAFCQAHHALTVGVLLLRYSVVCTVTSLSLFYLLLISRKICTRR